MSKKFEDWTTAEAKKAAKVFRENGIRARAVTCKNYESYAMVYYADDAEVELIKKVRNQLEDDGCDFNWRWQHKPR